MFPFRKTPPSKVEVARKAVADAAHAVLDVVPTELIEDKFDDLKKSAASVALHAVQVAHHASEVASHKLEGLQQSAAALGDHASEAAHRASEAAHRASEVAHRASDTAHVAGESALTIATAKAKAAREAALAAKETAKETAQDTRDSLQERAGVLLGSAAALKGALQERASHDLETGKARVEAGKAHLLDAKAAAEKVAQHEAELFHSRTDAVKSKFARKKSEAEDYVENIEVPSLPAAPGGPVEVQYSETGSKLAWVLLGLAVGAVLVLLFAPTSGRRSRAAIKGRLDKVSDGVVDAATATSDKVVDIAHRVEGIAHKVEAKINADAETDDDSTIADRVRSVLGHHEIAKALDRINVDCNEGVITLRGPVIDEVTQETIVTVIKAVPGVKGVNAEFLIDEPVDPATSVA